ncbi:MAG: AbrB/MazE/SpoVT family DNA-binding domain-containing protein [Pseudonocardia sp.]
MRSPRARRPVRSRRPSCARPPTVPGGTITLPAELREQLDLREGDQVAFELVDDRVIVTPVAVVPRQQAWFWSREWQQAEREADDDIAAGRYTRYESDDDFFAALTDG